MWSHLICHIFPIKLTCQRVAHKQISIIQLLSRNNEVNFLFANFIMVNTKMAKLQCLVAVVYAIPIVISHLWYVHSETEAETWSLKCFKKEKNNQIVNIFNEILETYMKI